MERDDPVTEALKGARARIADPGRWCRYGHAETAKGHGCSPHSALAVRWCALGALEAQVPILRGRGVVRRVGPAFEVFRLAAARLRGAAALVRNTPAGVNDELGHAATLEMFDEAIRRK